MNAVGNNIAEDLRRLGLFRGDLVLVRVALKSIGFEDGNPAIGLIQTLVEVIGNEGTIVGLAHNDEKWFPYFHKDHVVNLKTAPNTGGFVKAMVTWPGSLRSRHPTNSFVAIGKLAGEIVDGHDENAYCFAPMEKLVEFGGKMILIGCIKNSPGFSTVHLAQEKLGLAKRSLLSGVQGTYFEKNGKIVLFRKKDVPGCSMGFQRFYSDYLAEGQLRAGFVGKASSILIGAKQAFEIELKILNDNPKYALCDNPRCFVCRGTRLYNLADMLGFYLVQAPKKALRKLAKKRFK